MSHFTGRKKEAAPLEEAFQELLKAYRLEGKFREKSLIHDWSSLVGKTIGDRTQSVFIRDKKLFVKITSGPVKREIQMNKSKILRLIEERYGVDVIEDLVCL
ncbi:MAG: Protein of unknown function (DUF721) [Algoriphagus marincola HL-49]|uniref:DUF721 domain-containing protein n=1 Tax=Algoriphagus marincola HL-49 TaxID=1305737 RepID=A0A0P7YGZ4_9BACT|nr:MAG: Protein of unknown function (DUF721) [Algoriphagus marincola HL-49]